MTIYLKGRPPFEVDGLDWTAACFGKIVAVEVYDDRGEYLGVELFDDVKMEPGDMFHMPAEVTCEKLGNEAKG